MFKTAKAWISSLISYVSGPRDECSIGLIEIRDSNPPLPEPINNAANTPRSLDDLVYAQERVYRDEVPGTDGVWMVEDPGTGQLYFIRYDEFRGPGQRGFTQVFGGPYTEASYLGKLDGNPVFVASRLKSYDPGTDRDISAIVNEKGDALFGGWQDGAPMLTPIDSSEDSMRELFNDSRDYDCANCEYDADLKLQSGRVFRMLRSMTTFLSPAIMRITGLITCLSLIERAGSSLIKSRANCSTYWEKLPPSRLGKSVVKASPRSIIVTILKTRDAIFCTALMACPSPISSRSMTVCIRTSSERHSIVPPVRCCDLFHFAFLESIPHFPAPSFISTRNAAK